MQKRRKTTKTIATCSLLASIGVLILYIGSVFEVMDISVSVIASFSVIIAVIEFGGFYPWLVYAVISLLSFILLPQKSPALFFSLFAGVYPILKEKIEKKRLVALGWTLKAALFCVCMALIYLLAKLIAVDLSFGIPIAVTGIILAATFVLYDLALTKIITAYILVWRKKLKIL